MTQVKYPNYYVCFYTQNRVGVVVNKSSVILMWFFDAEGQNNTHLGCDLSKMMGCLFCSLIGLSHLFLSSVLMHAFIFFLPCPSYLFCIYFPLSCYSCHTLL